MKDGAVVLRNVASARSTLELPPGTTIGMAIGTQIAPSQPTAIATAGMGTEVPGGVHRAGAAVGGGHRLGWHRRWRLGMRGFLRTQGTRWFVRQARKRWGLVGACALRLEGFRLGWPRLGPGASAGPDGVQHHTEPQQSQHHELIVKQVWNHSIAPSPWDDMGALYRVFGAGQLSAGYGYTTQGSQVTAFADGANNCWSVLSVVQPHCKTLECILDWFHIGKKFQNIKNALGEAFEKSLESIKWKLWHGKARDALTKLVLLRDNITDEEQRSKMTGLHDYIQRNQAYIVNYEERNNAKKPYTSQVAESHVDTIINARHKKTRKMQWTREGAHHVLQIRAMIASEEWSNKWQSAVLSSLKDAV